MNIEDRIEDVEIAWAMAHIEKPFRERAKKCWGIFQTASQIVEEGIYAANKKGWEMLEEKNKKEEKEREEKEKRKKERLEKKKERLERMMKDIVQIAISKDQAECYTQTRPACGRGFVSYYKGWMSCDMDDGHFFICNFTQSGYLYEASIDQVPVNLWYLENDVLAVLEKKFFQLAEELRPAFEAKKAKEAEDNRRGRHLLEIC